MKEKEPQPFGSFNDLKFTSKLVKSWVITNHFKHRHRTTQPTPNCWDGLYTYYNLTWIFVSGNQNLLADWHSRSSATVDVFDDDPSVGFPSFIQLEAFAANWWLLPIYSVNRTASQSHSWLSCNGYKRYVQMESRDTYKRYVQMYVGTDGIKYHIRTNRVYVPPPLRDTFMHWFHVTYMGLHLGSNRTIRRLTKWVWWPKLNADVRRYVNACLICARKLFPSKLTTISGVLSRPLPLQLVSLDFVRPRDWSDGQTFYYLVIVYHASRLMVTCSLNGSLRYPAVIGSLCLPLLQLSCMIKVHNFGQYLITMS